MREFGWWQGPGQRCMALPKRRVSSFGPMVRIFFCFFHFYYINVFIWSFFSFYNYNTPYMNYRMKNGGMTRCNGNFLFLLYSLYLITWSFLVSTTTTHHIEQRQWTNEQMHAQMHKWTNENQQQQQWETQELRCFLFFVLFYSTNIFLD